MKKRRQLLALMLICLGLGLAGKTAKADSIFTSPYVEIAPDGRAWTVDQELTGYGATGLPDLVCSGGGGFQDRGTVRAASAESRRALLQV